MIDFPREMRAGDDVSATEYNRLVRALRAIYPVQGPGMALRRTPNGTVFEAASAKATPAPSPKPWTFTVEVEGQQGSETYTAKWGGMTVQYGYQIIALSPTPGGPGLSLAEDGEAEWEASSIAALAQDVAGTHWLKVDFKKNEYSIVVQASSAQPPQDDLINSIIHVRIGTVVYDSTNEVLAQTAGIYTAPVLYKYV